MFIFGIGSNAKADLVFSVVQSTPANGASLFSGLTNAGEFDILVRSTVANQSFLGVDFTLTLSELNGDAGLFASGVNVLFPNSSNPGGFITGTFSNGPVGEVVFSTLSNSAVTLGTSDSLLARVVLTTVGASLGNYSMSLSGLDAIDSGFNQIASSSAGPLTYSIAAVPEPSSMALLGCVALGGYVIRRRRRLAIA
jgi:hypothetical protein